MSVHGISIKHRDTKELVEFIRCDVGRDALRVLSGVRINLGDNYVATEDFATEEEIQEMKTR